MEEKESYRSLERISNLEKVTYIYVFLSAFALKVSGDDDIEETPVPIPNTEVKLYCAEDTCGLPCWKNRLSPGLYSSLAQLVERSAVEC